MAFEGFNLRIPDSLTTAFLDPVERDFWIDLWRSPVLDAVAEDRIELRWYGPLQATVVAELPDAPLLNLLLGAADPGAVSDGHLVQALEWIDSLGVDCRVSVDPRGAEAGAAEELLNQWGYRRTESQVRFTRGSNAPDFPSPPGIEVIQLEEFTEGFAELMTEGYGLRPGSGTFFSCLPERFPWHCYVALDEREWPRAAAATMTHWDLATHLGFATTEKSFRGRGFHTALLHRCISDAGRHSPTLFAETCEPLDSRDGPSPGCRNLLRAGFRQVSLRHNWRRELDFSEDEEDEELLGL